MKVEFDYTIDELVEVSLRSVRKTKSYQTAFQRGLLTTGSAAFAIAFLLFNYSFAIRFLLALLFGVFSAATYLFLQQTLTERKLKKYYFDLIGDKWPIHLEIELTPAAIVTRERETETSISWKRFAQVSENNKNIEFLTREGSLIVVRGRAFHNDEEKQRFFDLAKNHLENSEQSKS